MTHPLDKALRIIIEVSNPDKVILFGSSASEKESPGRDYDLLVLKKGVKSRRKMTQEIYRNFKNIGAPIDVIVADLETFEAQKTDPYLVFCDAATKGRVIYEKS